MLPAQFVVVSLGIRLFSGGRYAWGVAKGRARPNPISWFLWGATSLIAFVAQLGDLQAQSFVTLVLGITPIVVCVLAVAKNGLRAHFTPFNIGCAVLAVLGIVLWQKTGNPMLAIVFAIVADVVASLPTLAKAYHDPASEYGLPYLLSAASMVVTVLTIDSWKFTIYAFPLYMLCINLVLYSFATLPLKRWACPVCQKVLKRREPIIR